MKAARFNTFWLVAPQRQELAKKFNYDEYEVVYGLSNEL